MVEDVQLFPVLSCGSHLWDMDRVSVTSLMNRAYGKGVRRGLGMRKKIVVDRLGKWFVEASEKVKKLQLMYMKRSFHSVNGVVN